MNLKLESLSANFRYLLAIMCTFAILPGDSLAYMPSPPSARAASPQDQAAKIPPDQLDSLVAPIALYPDPMLAQTLAASTYPLEVIQLQQWLVKNTTLKDKALAAAVMKQPWDPRRQAVSATPDRVEVIQLQQWLVKNPTLKDNALADAVMKQPWDPSVQALAALPEVVKRLADDIQGTTDLGNAFPAQQSAC